MENLCVILILTALVFGAVAYLVKARRRGGKCIGCPYARDCIGKCKGKK